MNESSKRIENNINALLKRIPIRFRHVQPFDPDISVAFFSRFVVWKNLDKNSETILDLGCYKGGAMETINVRSKKKFFRVGVDLFLPFLKQSKKDKVYDDYVLCDARYLPFRSKTFDTVISIEVVEHLQKDQGWKLIQEMEEIACRQIIVTTPVVPGKPTPQATILTELQTHKSLWKPQEFIKLGYEVKGILGPSFLPRYLAYGLSFVFPYFNAELSHKMICIKRCMGKL